VNLAVIGSRDFNDYALMQLVLLEYCAKNDVTIVSGGARGADKYAEMFANEYHIPTIIKLADWDNLGKSAGYIRNAEIVNECDEVVAFWDGKSKGSKHTIDLARKKGKTVVIIMYKEYTHGTSNME